MYGLLLHGTDDEKIIIVCLIASFMVLVLPIVAYIFRRILFKASYEAQRRSGLNTILVISAHVFASLTLLGYAANYYVGNELTWWEKIGDSVVSALQSFSINTDYTEYIVEGKGVLRRMLGEQTKWQYVFSLGATALNVFAPVLGGAAIFEILASIFPRIRLILLNYICRPKYYFSELNEASVSLAKSIKNTKAPFLRKPIFIFTDSYIDSAEEKDSELKNEAKALGAICVKDDLIHVKKSVCGSRKFFLIDDIDKAQTDNLQKLTKLADSYNGKFLKNSEVYLLTNDDAYIQIEKNVREKLKAEWGFTDEELPVLIPVNGYRNLISNLLVELPLYEPLIGKKRNSDGTVDLTVTILGIGYIGMEMFLSTYWFGQMLDCNLKINIIAKETEEEFWSKIDFINPEIKRTRDENDPILRINRKGEMAKPYFTLDYHHYDVKSSEFIYDLQSDKINILETDYYLVAIGSDEDNISIANTIREYLGQHHISLVNASSGADDIPDAPNRAVIAYVVYNNGIAETLNRKKRFHYAGDTTDIYMCAIGSRNDVYSVKNVFMSKYDDDVLKVHGNYDMIKNKEQRAEDQKKRLNDNYNYWSSLARAMHKFYKVFSLGLLNRSVLDYDDPKNKEYRAYRRGVLEEYRKLISNTENKPLMHKLAWLEHRRWCAFLRIKGFRHTSDYDAYAIAGEKGTYKQMDLKLHPCLVECDDKGIKATMGSNGIVDETTCFRCTDTSDFDLLDDLSYDLYNKKFNSYDFKMYDYPRYYDFDED